MGLSVSIFFFKRSIFLGLALQGEGILCAFERGHVDDWRKIWRSIHTDKSKKVTADVAQAKEVLNSGDLGYAISRLF